MGDMVNGSERLINVVITDKRKMLSRLNQKVRSQLLRFILGAHGYTAAGEKTEPKSPDKLSVGNVVSP